MKIIKEEKLDYIKNMKNMKVKLLTTLVKNLKKDKSCWYIDLDNNTFTCKGSISYIFDKNIDKNGLEKYLSTYSKDDLKKTSSFFSDIKNNFSEFSIERELINSDNSSLYIVEHVNYIASKNLLIGTIQDITELHNIKQNIQNIDRIIYQFMQFFDQNVAIIECTKDGIITHASLAFCNITGFKEESILGKPLSFFESKEDNIDILKIFQSLQTSKLIWSGEIKYQKKNGSIFWTKAFVAPIFNQENELIEFTIICHDITTQKALETLTNHDSMTGIYNRRYYDEIIPKEINRVIRDKKNISFAMLDIDYFKQYNDIYGHRKGDEIIITIAKLLENSLKRGSDYVFRMGGEEFCIVFSDYDSQKSLNFCENILKKIQNLKIPHKGSTISKYLSISIGLVVSDLANEVIDELGLYTTSDNALYEAKAAGRNQVFVHKANDISFFD